MQVDPAVAPAKGEKPPKKAAPKKAKKGKKAAPKKGKKGKPGKRSRSRSGSRGRSRSRSGSRSRSRSAQAAVAAAAHPAKVVKCPTKVQRRRHQKKTPKRVASKKPRDSGRSAPAPGGARKLIGAASPLDASSVTPLVVIALLVGAAIFAYKRTSKKNKKDALVSVSEEAAAGEDLAQVTSQCLILGMCDEAKSEDEQSEKENWRFVVSISRRMALASY